MSRAVRALLCLVTPFVIGACATAHTPPGSGRLTVPSARDKAPRDTFVSLVPACACNRHTELELFSRSSGRMLRKLGTVSTGGDYLYTPRTASDGQLFFTFTSGPK